MCSYMQIHYYSFGVAVLVPCAPCYFLVYSGFLFVVYFQWIAWAVPAFLRAGHMSLAEQCVFWADFVFCRCSSHFPGDAVSLCFNLKIKISVCEKKSEIIFLMIKWNRRVRGGDAKLGDPLYFACDDSALSQFCSCGRFWSWVMFCLTDRCHCSQTQHTQTATSACKMLVHLCQHLYFMQLFDHLREDAGRTCCELCYEISMIR